MARVVRHISSDNKRLYDYSKMEALSDCDEFICCLSERSLYIILNSMSQADQMKTRLYTSRDGEYYTLANLEQFGNYQQWFGQAYSELGSWVMCNEYLERIAVALESQAQALDEQTVNLTDVFEALGIEPTESEADILEALDYLINFPGMPELPKLPLGQWISAYFDGRYKAAQLQLLRDMAISQRGIAVATGGVDFASLYDTMGETADSLIVKAGYAGKAYWLWRWLDNDQIPGWAGWVITISGAILGSIRGATYDIVEALTGFSLSGIEAAIRDQTNANIVNCNNCTSKQMYNIINDDTIQGDYAVVEDDSGWTDYGAPPASDDTTWSEPLFPDDTKCQGARYIVGWLIGFYGREEWNLEETDNMLSLADKMKNILSLLPPIGASLNGLSVIIGRILSYLSGGNTSIFITVNEVLVDLEEELVCAIYTGAGPEESREAFLDVLRDDGRLDPIAIQMMNTFLTMNNIMALPFYVSEAVQPYIESFGTECNCGETGTYTFVLGNETSVNPSNPITGEMPYIAGWACGANAREVAINFHVPVTITSIEMVGAEGSCGTDIFHYYQNENFDTVIAELNGRPQDTSPVPGVRSMYILVSSSSPVVTFTMSYTLD